MRCLTTTCNKCTFFPMKSYIQCPAPLRHRARTGEETVHKTNIKQCTKCHCFRPHWHYLESTRSLDGLSAQCTKCRSTKSSESPKSFKDYGYYDDNPAYFKLMRRARYLETKATETIKQEQRRKLNHALLFPSSPFYSSSERFAYDDLAEAKRLRKKAGKPTQ
jgi:hypothetical protein